MEYTIVNHMIPLKCKTIQLLYKKHAAVDPFAVPKLN